MKLTLVTPSEEYKRSYLEAVKGFKAEGLWWHQETDIAKLDPEFDAFIEELRNSKGETTFWAIINDEFAGRISVRHELTPALRIMGGNIGYDVAPKFRKQGVASEMLRKVLPFAKSLGLIEVLITCDDTNVGSIKAIEKNGGILKEERLLAEGKPLKRYYWINL
ncbi:MAG: GNAT family N-acetyltransferase [Bacteriovoracaceae bacterium]